MISAVVVITYRKKNISTTAMEIIKHTTGIRKINIL